MRFAEKKRREGEEETEEGDKQGSELEKHNLFKIHQKKEVQKEAVLPVMDHYFMVSSKAFLDRNLFPPVHIEKKKFWTIKTDFNNFRINDAYKKEDGHDKKKQPNDKFFYFRLSGLNMYYTNTPSDINILGAISVASMDTILKPSMDASSEYITTCFILTDIERQKYKICGMEEEKVKHWYCQIKSFLGQQDMDVCMKDGAGDTKVITKTIEITQPIVIVPLASSHCNQNWNYQKFGDDWECDCKEGSEQSPIDLPKIRDTLETGIAPLFRYNKVGAKDVEPTVDGINIL